MCVRAYARMFVCAYMQVYMATRVCMYIFVNVLLSPCVVGAVDGFCFMVPVVHMKRSDVVGRKP